jgi:hypothetical protein
MPKSGCYTGLTGFARQSSITRAGLAKIATHTGKQIGFAGLAKIPGLAEAAARINR